jgi:ABC-type cobalamin/Fe3+-siderophores transport system ATPase subunit
MTGGTDGSSIILTKILAAQSNPENGRIFTMVGPSGAGKSRILHDLFIGLKGVRVARLFIRARRDLHLDIRKPGPFKGPITLNPNPPIEGDFWPTMLNEVTSGEPDAIPFEDALAVIFRSLSKFKGQTEQAYHDEIISWYKAGREGPEPKLQPDILDVARRKIKAAIGYDFNIGEHSNQTMTHLEFQNDGVTFTLNELSDGEKQILYFSALLFTNNDSQFVFLVDEPELHLNEARCIEIWEALENQFPSVIFLYATHSINFATRPAVDCCYLVKKGQEIDVVNRELPIPAAHIRDMVGARVQLARTEAAPVFCEDNLSKLILTDLLYDLPTEIIPCSGWETVIAAVRGDSGWDIVRSKAIRHCGVIDRDTRYSEEIGTLAAKGVFCFPIYEAESLLLDPVLALGFLSKSKGKQISRADYIDLLVDAAKNSIPGTLARLSKFMAARSPPSISYKLEADVLSEVTVNQSTLLSAEFEANARKILEAVQSADISTILELIKGKLIYQNVVVLAKQRLNITLPRDPIQKYNELRGDSDFKQQLLSLPWLGKFKKEICEYLTKPLV